MYVHVSIIMRMCFHLWNVKKKDQLCIDMSPVYDSYIAINSFIVIL